MISMTWPQYMRGECSATAQLSRMETEVLSTLLLRHPAPVSLHQMIEAIYPDPDRQAEYATRAVPVFVMRLRNKIGRDQILTTPQGYRLGADQP